MSSSGNILPPAEILPPAKHGRRRHDRGAALSLRTPLAGLLAFTGAVALASCSTAADPSARPTDRVPEATTSATSLVGTSAGTTLPVRSITAGKRVAALDFTLPSGANSAATEPVSLPTATTIDGRQKPSARSAEEALRAFLDAVTAGRYEDAFALLSATDQARVGSTDRLAAEVAPFGWTSFSITSSATPSATTTTSATASSATSSSITAEIMQTPRISDIDGLIAPTATAVFQMSGDPSGSTVDWSRRVIVAHHPERSEANDAGVSNAAVEWAAAAQRCAPQTFEFSGGLIGVTGLADQLCRSVGPVTVQQVGELDLLDEPQPVIDGFGSAATTWARVVYLTGPANLNLVMAPVADKWIAIAIARPSLAQSARADAATGPPPTTNPPPSP